MEVNYRAILTVFLVLCAFGTLKNKVLAQIGFDMTPQNTTIIAGKPLIFNCSTTDFRIEGIDWTFTNDSGSYPISQCQKFDNCFLDLKNYKLERPNNFSNNLIVLHANPVNAGKYCCQYPNGMRVHDQMACAFATAEGSQTTAIPVSTTGQTSTGSTTGNTNFYELIIILVAILVHL